MNVLLCQFLIKVRILLLWVIGDLYLRFYDVGGGWGKFKLILVLNRCNLNFLKQYQFLCVFLVVKFVYLFFVLQLKVWNFIVGLNRIYVGVLRVSSFWNFLVQGLLSVILSWFIWNFFNIEKVYFVLVVLMFMVMYVKQFLRGLWVILEKCL